jgi:hypothetical protein
LTTLDLWLLVTKFQIPTIFISQKKILQTNYEKNELLGYGTRDDDFAFIVLPGFRPENIPSYKLILSDKNDSFISLDRLNDTCVERIYNAIETPITVETYLTDFIKPSKTKYVKKKQNIIIIEEDEDQDEPVEKERKRCKNGERRNKMGECVKKETFKPSEPIQIVESESEEEPILEEAKKVRSRCKNGERRNKMGECVKKETFKPSEQIQIVESESEEEPILEEAKKETFKPSEPIQIVESESEEEPVLEVAKKVRSRCKNGERRNKMGECVKKETFKPSEPIQIVESESEEEPILEEEKKVLEKAVEILEKVRSRCKNGERRNKLGECVKKETIKKKETKEKTKKTKKNKI